MENYKQNQNESKFRFKNLLRKSLSEVNLKSFMTLALASLSSIAMMGGDLTVNVTSSNGGALPGAKFSVTRGPNHIGNFDAGQTINLVDGATYTIFAYYNNTSTKREVFVSSANGDVFDFKTTNVKFNFSGGYLNYKSSGSWSSFTKTNGVWNDRELFPRDFYGNMMTIQTGYLWNDVRSISFEVNYEGQQNFHRNINVIRVQADDNSPISGAKARGGNGTSFGTWHVSGQTNSQGLLVDLRPYSANGTYSYEARVNNTTSTAGPQSTSSNSYFSFKTVKVSLKLETCNGAPLSGGRGRFGNGNTFGTWFFPTPNNTDANGVTSAQLFPGTYSFEMGYQSSAEVKYSVSIPNANTELVWKTTTVNLNWAGSISYGGNGDSRFFNKPSMELLPGTLNFNFRGTPNNYVALNISGCDFNGTMLKAVNEDNQPVEGMKFQPACGGSWQSQLPGQTNASGLLFANIPNCMTKIRASLGNSSMEKSLSDLTASNNTFTTQVLQICLLDHAGNPITDETGSVAQGGGTWIDLGNLNNQGCIRVNTFPVTSARYRMTYNCNSEIKDGFTVDNAAGIQTVNWQTGKVVSSCGQTSYQGCGWSTFTSGMEQLPGTRTFRNPSVTETVVAGQVLDLCGNNNNANPIFGGSDDDFSEYDNYNAPVKDMKNMVSSDKVTIYPNPSSDNFNISIVTNDDSKSNTSVVNISGKELFNFNAVGSTVHKVETSTLASGIYFVITNINGNITSTKLVVNK